MTVAPTAGPTEAYTPGQASSSQGTSTDPTTYTTGPLAYDPTSGTSTTGETQENSQMFLSLLVAQLQYQDPDNPADTSDMVTQEAQMTELQAMQNLASQNQELLSSQLAYGATAMIGKDVTYDNGDGTSTTGMVSSVAFGQSGPILAIDGVAVPYSAVLAVNGASTSTAHPPSMSVSADDLGLSAWNDTDGLSALDTSGSAPLQITVDGPASDPTNGTSGTGLFPTGVTFGVDFADGAVGKDEAAGNTVTASDVATDITTALNKAGLTDWQAVAQNGDVVIQPNPDDDDALGSGYTITIGNSTKTVTGGQFTDGTN